MFLFVSYVLASFVTYLRVIVLYGSSVGIVGIGIIGIVVCNRIIVCNGIIGIVGIIRIGIVGIGVYVDISTGIGCGLYILSLLLCRTDHDCVGEYPVE